MDGLVIAIIAGIVIIVILIIIIIIIVCKNRSRNVEIKDSEGPILDQEEKVDEVEDNDNLINNRNDITEKN